jgi:uncharacterized Zn finger protein (UPF0148 family)
MLLKCVKCRFYVRQTDVYCPNCGLNDPTQQQKEYSKEFLSQRANRLNTILDKIGDNPSQNLQEIQQKLLSAKEIIIRVWQRQGFS